MPQYFSAIDIEDPEILEELERIRDRIDLGFNTVSGDKMHITLQFFKGLDREQLEEVESTMEAVSAPPFTLDIKNLGAFPSNDYIRVIWAGAESDNIQQLYRQVSDHSIESDNNHDFQPHVTLARVKSLSPSKKKKLQKSLKEFEDHYFGTMEVSSVKLFESRLTGKGSRYKLIKEKQL